MLAQLPDLTQTRQRACRWRGNSVLYGNLAQAEACEFLGIERRQFGERAQFGYFQLE
jgi:hypothetical protein